MALKNDLKSVFEKNLADRGNISDISKAIVDVYKKSVDSSMDSVGNPWTGVLYPTIEKAINAQFQLSFNTNTYLQFSLIETALVTAWATSTLKGKIPAPGMSSVSSGLVTTSIPPGTPPLISFTGDYDPIVDAFFSMFSNHAKSLIFIYIGKSSGGSPITKNVSSFLIK